MNDTAKLRTDLLKIFRKCIEIDAACCGIYNHHHVKETIDDRL